MTNHFHLVLETPQGNLSRFMHALTTGYSVFYNRRHARMGHLFQGRYGAQVVQTDEYLLALSRYVHLNPVFVGRFRIATQEERRKELRRYPWSSYPGYAGTGRPVDFVDYGPILATFAGKGSVRQSRYRVYVEGGIGEPDREFASVLKKPWPAIGGESFRAWVEELHDKMVRGRKRKEDVSFCRMREPLEPAKILEAVAARLKISAEDLARRRRGRTERWVATRMLCRHGGLTQREAAAVMGLTTGAAVSLQLRRLDEKLARDRKLRRLVEDVEQAIEATQTVRLR
jgi:hypothetical protein